MENLKKIKNEISEFLKNMQKHNISEFAAQCAYYIILSFIPFIILIITLIQYMGIDKQNLFIMMQSIIPNTMNITILNIIEEVYSKSIGTISISLIFVIWAAGKGFYSLCKGLQVIYENKKKNTYIFLKLRSIMCTIGFCALIILALGLMVFGKTIGNSLEKKLGITSFIFKIKDLLVTIVIFLFLLLVYKIIPRNKNKFKEQIPGAIIAALSWNIISKIFSMYLTVFKGFSLMYGSLTTIMLIMMWVYFCIYAVLIGAEINYYIIKKKKIKKENKEN